MNNIPQKNVILGFRESNLLPYGKSDVKFVNNQTINQINVNNALQQLRDNDLYIENQLNYLSGYEPGPRAYTSDISSTYVDGQKYWLGTEPTQQLSIIHKTNKTPQNSLSRNTTAAGESDNVTYIVRYSGLYFCGTASGTAGKVRKSEDSKTWEQLLDGVSYTYHKGDDSLLVGCGKNIVFVQVGESESGSPTTTTYQVNSSNAFGNTYPTAINVDDQKRLYVGTQNGEMYMATYSSIDDFKHSNLPFTKLGVNFTNGGQVNDIAFRQKNEQYTDDNFIMATFDNVVAESEYQKSLLNEKWMFENGQLSDMIQIGSTIYIGGTSGLSSISNTGVVTAKNTKPIYALDQYTQQLYYITKDASNTIDVYRGGDGEGTRVVRASSTASPTDLVVVQDGTDALIFMASTGGIQYFYKKENSVKWLNVNGTNQTFPTYEMSMNMAGNILYLYATQTVNSKKVFTVYTITMSGGSLIVESDSTEIQSLEKWKTASNSIDGSLYKYRTGFVYVDGKTLRTQSGDSLKSFNTSIRYVKRITNESFGDQGLLIITENEIWFVRETYQEWKRIYILSDDDAIAVPQTSDIKDIVISDDYIYVITESKILICKWSYENLNYRLSICSKAEGSNLSCGYIINSILNVLNSNKLSSYQLDFVSNTKKVEFEYTEGEDAKTFKDISIFDCLNDPSRIYLANGTCLSVLYASSGQGDETSLSLINKLTASSQINSVKYNGDNDIIIVRDTNSLSIINGSVSSDVPYIETSASYTLAGLTGIKSDQFIDGKYVIADSSGLKVLDDKILLSVFQSSPENLSTYKDWQFFDFGEEDDGLLRMFTYASSSKIQLYQITNNAALTSNSGAILLQAESGSISNAKLVHSDILYVSYVSANADSSNKISATYAYGIYGNQTVDGYKNDKVKIASKYFPVAYPCEADHCLFKNSAGVYVDTYTTYGAKKSEGEGDDQVFYKEATAASTLTIHTFSGDQESRFMNLDAISKSGDTEIALINLKTQIILVPFILTKKLLEEGDECELLPSYVASVNSSAKKTITVKRADGTPAQMLKVFFQSCTASSYDCSILEQGSDGVNRIYNVSFNSNASQITLNDSDVVISNVNDLISDSSYHQPCYITQSGSNYSCYHLQSGQLMMSGMANKNLRNGGNQNGFGFAYGTDNEVTQIRKTTKERQFNLYNGNSNLRDCVKIETDNNYAYFLKGNSIYGIKYSSIASIRNVSPTRIQVKNGSSYGYLMGVQDFTVYNNTLYYISTSEPNVLRSRPLENDYEFGNENTYKLTKNVNEIELVQSNIGQMLNLELNLFLKTGDDYVGITESIPKLVPSGGFNNINKVIESDNSNFYIRANSKIQKITPGGTLEDVVASSQDIIPYGNGFGYIYSNEYYIWDEDNAQKVVAYDSLSPIHGFYKYGKILYSMKSDGLYTPKYKKVYTLPVEQSFRQEIDVCQISPMSNTANANLVVFDQSQGNQERYCIYNGNANIITFVNINGIEMYSVTGGEEGTMEYVESSRQYFEKAMIMYGSNNGVRFLKSAVDTFHCSWNGGRFETWILPKKAYSETLQRGYYFNGTFYIIAEKDGKQKLWSFTGYTDKLRAFSEIKRDNGANFGKLLELGDNKYILDSDDGAFYVINSQFIRLTHPDTSVRSIKYIDFGSEAPQYYYAINNVVYRTPNYKKISINASKFITLASTIGRVNDIYARSPYEFLFATNKGLYQTTYQFTISNDLTFFNESQVNSVYRNMVSTEISTMIDVKKQEHIDYWHNKNSVIDNINTKIVDVDFSMTPAEWKHIDISNSEIVVSNDIVSEITFGNQDNSMISVYTKNFIKSDRPNFNYILKRYSSGMTELYILLDTTNTYYISHVPGAGCSTTEDLENGFSRKNLETFGYDIANIEWSADSGVSFFEKFKTSISVIVVQSELSVDRLLDYQINGCSLPLKIYPDIDGESFASRYQVSCMYQSLILPSQIKLVDASNNYHKSIDLWETTDGSRIKGSCFISECFGTDQQSIKLHFFDPLHQFDSNGFVVIFHGQGGYVNGDRTQTTYSQRFSLSDTKPLKRNLFTKTYTDLNIDEIFIGWSLSAVGENLTDFKHFGDTETVSKTLFETVARANPTQVEKPFGTITRGTEVHLYAVWQTYQFSTNDTILKLNVGTEQFAIDNYAIRQVQDRGELKNIVIVNFDNPT